MRLAELADQRVAVWGYGREGRAAIAALRARLPELPLTLFCNAAEAQVLERQASAASDGEGIAGSHASLTIMTDAPEAATLAAFDVVIKSPGISPYRPEIVGAQQGGTRFISGTALWFAEHPQARVIAVTGTKGKSTVSALIAHLLRALGHRVALAGNIGLPLLELLDPPQCPDWWVVELSSFQTREAAAVDVAVINNLFEEHLDWHGSRERYAADKLALADVAERVLVNAQQDELVARLATHPRCSTFGDVSGWSATSTTIMRNGSPIFDLTCSPLRGHHNAMNLCAALAAVEAAGLDAVAAARAIARFRPLPHRMQVLGTLSAVTWVDDSIATTPQATLEALESFSDRPVTVLVGGFDRGLDWRPFSERVPAVAPHAIITMGANGARIAELLRAHAGAYELHASQALAEAVDLARRVTPAGGVVLLSPGAPSFDQFRDYAERGHAFARLAGFEPAAIDLIAGLGIL